MQETIFIEASFGSLDHWHTSFYAESGKKMKIVLKSECKTPLDAHWMSEEQWYAWKNSYPFMPKGMARQLRKQTICRAGQKPEGWVHTFDKSGEYYIYVYAADGYDPVDFIYIHYTE